MVSLPQTQQPSTCWLRRLQRDIAADLRSAPWTRFGQGYLLGLWLFCLVFVVTMIPVYLSAALTVSGGPIVPLTDLPAITVLRMKTAPGCLPTDDFNARSMRYNIFDATGLFQVTYGFGDLTFTQAKIVDIVWDVVVGRVGQVILTVFEWKAISTYFQNLMFRTPVTYNTFWTVFLDNQPSLISTWGLLRDFTTQSVGKKAVLAFIIISLLFIVAFPTLASAMTGYRPNSEAFVVDDTGSLIPFESFFLVAYVIHDGDRINLSRDQVITFTSKFRIANYYNIWHDSILSYDRGLSVLDFPTADDFTSICSGDEMAIQFSSAIRFKDGCELAHNVSAYVRQYGFLGLDSQTGERNNIPTSWMNQKVLEPALNISAFYLPRNSDYYFGHDWVDPRTGTKPYSNASNSAMVVNGTTKTYSMDYVQQHGRCQPLGNYQWGFSFLQAWIVSLLLLAWTVGTYLMWFGSHKTLKNLGGKEAPTKYAAAFALVAAMGPEIDRVGPAPALGLKNRKLEQVVKTDLKGGSMMAEKIPDLLEHGYQISRALWEWIKENKWWFTMLVLNTVFLNFWLVLGELAIYSCYLFALCLHTGMVFAVVVGRTGRSRFFFVFMGFMLGCVGGFAPFMYIIVG